MLALNKNVISFKYVQYRQVLLKLQSLNSLYDHRALPNTLEAEDDILKICREFSNALNLELSLEELSSLYSAAIMLLLLSYSQAKNERLELLNDCLNYSDVLKPTIIDYVTREIIVNLKYAAALNEDSKEYDYMLYLLWIAPNVITASATGKMISLGILRAFIAELTNSSEIVMHVYKNISEVWCMIKPVNVGDITDNWTMLKIYCLVKSFSLILATAALNSKNEALKQAGYRGFELPNAEMEIEINEWFKRLRNLLEEKLKSDSSKPSLTLVRFIDYNVLRFLTEADKEMASEAPQEEN